MNRICKTLCWPLTWLVMLTCLIVPNPSSAQESAEALFPASPEAWLNSPPLSLETLKNKAAVLYFFEEG